LNERKIQQDGPSTSPFKARLRNWDDFVADDQNASKLRAALLFEMRAIHFVNNAAGIYLMVEPANKGEKAECGACAGGSGII